MKNLYLIRGLPGSGKSTLAIRMQNFGMVHACFEADQFFMTVGGEYNFDPKLLKEAHKSCQDKTYQLMLAGYDVAVSNTFTQKWEMKPYLDMAEKLGYTVAVITCEGDYGSIHNVPEEAIQRMKDRWEKF